MSDQHKEIADNIRRELAEAGVPLSQFQRILSWMCILSSDPYARQIGEQWLAENK